MRLCFQMISKYIFDVDIQIYIRCHLKSFKISIKKQRVQVSIPSQHDAASISRPVVPLCFLACHYWRKARQKQDAADYSCYLKFDAVTAPRLFWTPTFPSELVSTHSKGQRARAGITAGPAFCVLLRTRSDCGKQECSEDLRSTLGFCCIGRKEKASRLGVGDGKEEKTDDKWIRNRSDWF